MIIRQNFTDRAVQVGFKITLDIQKINHAISFVINKSNSSENEVRYVKKNQEKWLLFMLN